MKKHFSTKHFSINLPVNDPESRNIPKLLRHVASNIEMIEGIEVSDIVFHGEYLGIDEDDVPYATVYYEVKSTLSSAE